MVCAPHLVLPVLMQATAAQPAPRGAPLPASYVLAEAGALSLLTSSASPSLWALVLAERVGWPAGVEVTLGARVLSGAALPAGVAVEGFAAAALAPEFGPWRPALGLELGVSGATRFVLPQAFVAPGSDAHRRGHPSPLYVTMVSTPLRFRFGRVGVSVLGLGFGTDALRPGRLLRVQVTYLQLEVRL